MIMSLRLGTNDVTKSRAFYNSTFTALGGTASVVPESMPMALYRLPDGPAFVVGPALNGEPTTFANGGTILLTAKDEAAVDAWYAAGMANGGTCEGPPGPRAQARDRYGAYMRDPDGNKFGCYAGSLFG